MRLQTPEGPLIYGIFFGKPRKNLFICLSKPNLTFEKMTTAITEGVKVSVISNFESAHSNADRSHFVFSYRIVIENGSSYTVQLLRRHWLIHDSNGTCREVEGEGVIGQQPVIEPGKSHEYVSACYLTTGLGKMRGSYLMERVADGKRFRVRIPDFMMITPHLNN
jgi:ApaG protein